MNRHVLIGVAVWLFTSAFSLTAKDNSPATFPSLEFYNCSNSPESLCLNDLGVHLPDNNQFFLGEGDPNATSCSVHFTQQVQLHSTCSKSFQYKIEVSYYDTSAYVEIQSWVNGLTNAQDEATLTFDTENSTNNEVSANGIPYTSGCFPYHRIKWTVMDSCGNMAFCDKRIELYDCSAPVPLNSQGAHVYDFHSGYEVSAHLDEFAGNYLDDCTSAGQYLFSTQSGAYQPDTVFNFCEVPIGVLVIVPIWVADAGRDLNCNGTISWDERNKYSVSAPVIFTADGTQDCSNPDLFISGEIKTATGSGVGKTQVTVVDANQAYPSTITDVNGSYAFPHTNYTYPVTVTPSRNDNIRNGVSTLDLVLIQKHLLGIEPFTQPDRFIAADANNSQSITAIDLVVLRKLILNLIDTLPGHRNWIFYPTEYVFPDPVDPWALPDSLPPGIFAHYVVIDNENETDSVDFTGVKVGDVNYSANPNIISLVSRSELPRILWSTEAKAYAPGDLIEIPVFNTGSSWITGFQFTLSDPDLEFLGITGGKADIAEDEYALMNDHLTASWFSIQPISIHSGDVLFTIKARARAEGNLQKSLQLTSDITEAEVYDNRETTSLPKLSFFPPEKDQILLYPCEPNPWSAVGKIPFYLQKATSLNFRVYTVNGTQVFAERKYYLSGYHELKLNAEEIPGSGLLYYILQSDTESAGGKMLLLK
jgi:hypothetical protein